MAITTQEQLCPQCGAQLTFVGNEDYAEDGNKYLYHCDHCGAEVEVYEALDEDKPDYPFWQNEYSESD